MKPIKVIKALNESTFEDKCEYIFNKYRDEFDTINEVRDLSDYINKLYSEGGMEKVDDEFFLPSTTEEYKNDFKSLINKKLKESAIENSSVVEEVNLLIKDEQEAIDGYEKAKTNCLKYNISSDEYDKLFKVFDHIIAEEREHIEELNELIGGTNETN